MNDPSIQRLIDTGYCFAIHYYQSLERDEEFDFTPDDHFRVSITISYEDYVSGWGPTLELATNAALAAMIGSMIANC